MAKTGRRMRRGVSRELDHRVENEMVNDTVFVFFLPVRAVIYFRLLLPRDNMQHIDS